MRNLILINTTSLDSLNSIKYYIVFTTIVSNLKIRSYIEDFYIRNKYENINIINAITTP